MLVILLLSFLLQKEEITANVNIKTYSSSDYETSKIDLAEQFNLSKSSGKGRSKRYIGSETIYYKESELVIRERLNQESNVNLSTLPKFGGKQADKPYANLIQVLTHTRSNVDGPVDGAYDHTTGDTISVSVDPIFHKFTKGRWTVFGGSRQLRCLPQFVFGTGQKAVFDCFNEGTYYAFFRVDGTYKDENDVVDGVRFRKPEEVTLDYDSEPGRFQSFFLDSRLFYADYEQKLLQDNTSLTKPWYYSDPIKIVKDSYCYRWSYRLHKENEVGFVHLEPSPLAISGIFREYLLKVWIIDPSEVSENELNSPLSLHPSAYSQIITRRFFLGGLVPCLRHAHSAVEVISDATYIKSGDVISAGGRHNSVSLYGPHWQFRIKVYMDRLVSSLSDIVFTISPRQHTALYECFVADVRVYIRAKSYIFLPNTKVLSTAINLNYSWVSDVERRFLTENVRHYFGHEAIYIGSPTSSKLNARKTTVQVFSNPCINQELSVSFNHSIGMTSDFFSRDELQRIILPSLDKARLGLNPHSLQLSSAQAHSEAARSNNVSYTTDKSLRIRVFDFAYTPVDIIFLLDDSSLVLHPTDLSLRGIGYNTFSSKYKLGGLVKRKWCAKTSTPKSHNMWIPAFSREYGNIIVIYQIPVEGARVIRQDDQSASCEVTRDSTKTGRREENTEFLSEKEIHADEADDARIDVAVEAKLRTKAAETKSKMRQNAKAKSGPKRKTIKDVQHEKAFWLVGDEVVTAHDPHYASGVTNARNVRVAQKGLEHYNDNIIFQIDANFMKLRNSFETHGLSFDIDEVIYANRAPPLFRAAPNHLFFALHSLEFTGVEKRYLLAIGFQSVEFPATANFTNSTLVMVSTFLANDLPVVVNSTTSMRDIELEKVDISFSGTLIRRLQNSHLQEPDPDGLTPEDFVDAQGRDITPGPLSRTTTKVSSINTALPLFVLRINEVILFASLDGSFAKPILSYEDYPIPEQDVTPKPYLPFMNFDILVTEQGVLSCLSYKETSGSDPVTPSGAFIGSVLANEPLRFIHPFHLSNNIFQVATEEGEIVYGQMSYDEQKELMQSPPKTKILNIPFWSLLKGSFARSAGDANIPLDRHIVSEGVPSAKYTHTYADPICPFASFDIYYVVFPYVEAQYTTRITAEVAYYGDVIPLEADIIVEFTEVQGVSVVVSSFLEVEYDQTIIRKTIEIETFLPRPDLEDMYNRHYSVQSDYDSPTQREEVHVFTLTIRPSLLNLHCQKKDYFRTIQMNVGCVPFTRMRLIAEALPLKKIEVQPFRAGLTNQDYETNWFHDESNSDGTGYSHLIVPRDSLHHSQRKSAGCEKRNQTRCRFRIPAGKKIEDNIYGLSFRDVLVPKFEQFLTQHARRVTGNVVIYDILDSYKDPLLFRLATNTSQYNARCLVEDGDWYGKMAKRANFYKKELTLKSDIYRYFMNCFTRRPSYQQEDLSKTLPLLSIQELNNRTFFIFNRTNRNALTLQRRRNFIYIFRAVVINTEFNAFTYCSNLDTFFALQVANMAPQRVPLQWQLYLIVCILIIILMVSSYVYFARYKHWRTRIVTNRIFSDDLEVEEALQAKKEQEELESMDPFNRMAEKAANIQKFEEIAASAKSPTTQQADSFNLERKLVTLDLLHQRISTLSKQPGQKNN